MRKHSFNVFISMLLIITLQSCYTIQTYAPLDSNVCLAEKSETLNFKEEKRIWFALWGAVPLSATNETPDKIIKEAGLTKVRVTVKKTLLDYLLNSITSPFGTLVSMTVIVEGERQKK